LKLREGNSSENYSAFYDDWGQDLPVILLLSVISIKMNRRTRKRSVI
jgi:hypothetical protein